MVLLLPGLSLLLSQPVYLSTCLLNPLWGSALVIAQTKTGHRQKSH